MKKPASSLATYSTTAKVFHWTTAIMILAQFPIGFTMAQLPGGPLADRLMGIHQMLGFAILWWALMRAGYRLKTGVARYNSTLAEWHARATNAAHYVLYVLLLAIPLTGWAGSSAGKMLDTGAFFQLPAILPPNTAQSVWLLWVHGLLALSLMMIVAVHICFAMQGYLDGSQADATASRDAKRAVELPASS